MFRKKSKMKYKYFVGAAFIVLLLDYLHVVIGVSASEVKVEIINSNPDGAPVVKGKKYASQVTLYVEEADGTLTPAGWSTRADEGGDGSPFSFTPGVGLIEGWTQGVLQMKEGERAKLHVPSHLGYGAREMGRKGAGWYIPANSNLCFDIEVLSPEKQEL
mmetsp:Transcript_5560/g.6534  ORF Transcript_5560/g.6534 Transcript_5560/m.6534 type:complete len:160 (-) Transcript_5560:1618-2097(-)